MSNETRTKVAERLWYTKMQPNGSVSIFYNHDNPPQTPIVIANDLWPDRATLIVRAVNSHDGLVASLDDLVFDAERVDSSDGGEQDEALEAMRLAITKARTALAKAKAHVDRSCSCEGCGAWWCEPDARYYPKSAEYLCPGCAEKRGYAVKP